jgi:D-sedoheptulose 7-phosphate isomerase
MLLQNIADARRTLEALQPLSDQVDAAARRIRDALVGGRKLMTCGNGGSAADAAHITTEFVCRFIGDRRPYPALCLATHGGDLTAIGNDYAFEQAFERQVQAFGQKGDVLLAISTSGNSDNVRRALEAAKDLGVHTIALLGRDGGSCAGLAEVELIVPATVTARIQEAHQLILHTLCDIVEPDLARG